MQGISFYELIDRNELQLLQERFCKVAGVYAYCLDGRGERITDLSGETFVDGAADRIQRMQKSQHVQTALERVEEGALEDLAIEEFPEGEGRVAAVAIRVQGKTVLYWVVFDLSDRDGASFAQTLDLLQDASMVIYTGKLSRFSAEAESRRSRDEQQEMSRTLHRIEASTGIIELLDSDERIELVMEQWLQILGQHLQAESAELFQLNADGRTMDVLCQWRGDDAAVDSDKTRGVPVCSALNTDKPLVFSTGSVPEELAARRLSAVMIFPVLCGENGTHMVFSIDYREKKHHWEMEEIKFASDSTKVLQNILARRIQKNSLAGSYTALETILDNVGCAIYVTDRKTGSMLFANRKLQNIFAKELRSKEFHRLIDRGMRQGREGGAFEIFYEEKSRWYEMLYNEISWMDGRNVILYSLYDITERKLYQRKIEQQAQTDFLTGLYNRMCCERDLAGQIQEAKRSQRTGAILYIDLDDFKHINDGLGHQYGDVLLKSISHSMQRVKGIENSCYRMGGDEFVVVISPIAYGRFDEILKDIKDIFSRPWFLKNADYYCTMSMGIVTFPDSGDSVSDLIKKADIAMYEAKKGGKNRTARYSDNILSESSKRLDMEKNMRDATAEGCHEFEVYYQPIIDIQEGTPRCKGAEALIRWNSTRQGFMTPAEFIPLAEYLGLINPIGNYMLLEACRHCKMWNEEGHPDYTVNVNLSVVQLLQPNIVELVKEALEKTGIEPGNLTLEVTESLAINDMERMKEILSHIKALGVRIALDDFGTGYSSLNHIREIPFDIIKVDQSFVRDLAEDTYSQAFIKMVAELAESIGVSICVEGIETADQYKVLQNMKVKYIQGYYFDRPMPRSVFEEKYIKQSKEEEK